MKNEILAHLKEPGKLEKLYRNNKASFRREFSNLYPEITGDPVAEFWNERLNYEKDEVKSVSKKEIIVTIVACLIAGLIAKLPAIFSIDEEFFYSRNVGFIIFPALSAYFAWKNKLSNVKMAVIGIAILSGLIFINSLPDLKDSDTVILSSIHLVLFLWSVLGFSFVSGNRINDEKRLSYLKYNGDLIVMTTLILIAGGIMTGVTIGLFSLIGLKINEFYFQYIGIFGLSSAPIVGTYLTQTNPQLVGKISPLIARIFSPLVLVMLVIYLIAIIYSGKDPYNDREFLLIFNGLLVGVMAIIFFSLAENTGAPKKQAEIWILLLLSFVTIILNSIALSAILFRISEWGITPNRTAVLGSNVLILIHLIMVSRQLYKAVFNKMSISEVGKTITFYLPIYVLWTIIVTFLFPLIFGVK